MTEKCFCILFENAGCSSCLFLDSGDTGENCKILRNDIQEGEWSNIDYRFEKNWRYGGCPLIYKKNLNKDINILRLKYFANVKKYKGGGE